MGQIDREILRQFAAKYIWWKTPGGALQYPDRVIAQVMDIGDYGGKPRAGDQAVATRSTMRSIAWSAGVRLLVQSL
ncbi:MAG: hypothetical protein ACT4QB_14350 [Gammaproteobacteria bacterium]